MKISVLKNKINAIKKVTVELFFNCFPIKKNTVMFYSFNGQYNDNPRYISEALHKIDESANIIWAMNKKCLGTQPDYVKAVLVDSLEYYYYSCVSSVFVDNYTGKHSFRKMKFI